MGVREAAETGAAVTTKRQRDEAQAGRTGEGLAGQHRAGKKAKMTRNQLKRLKKQKQREREG